MTDNSRNVRQENSFHIKKFLKLDNLRLGLFEKFLLLAPIFVWFSYQPLIRLAQSTTMNFELSFSLIYLTVLAIFALPIIVKSKQTLLRSRAVWLVGTLFFWQFLTLFWTVNLVRGILTFGVFALIFISFCAIIAQIETVKKILPALTKILIISAVVMGILAIIQMFVGIYLSRNETLLCAGCVAAQFGFARPNVFTIEPQFFGSLLLVPTLILMHFILTKKSKISHDLAFAFLVMVLILTLSRGAIFAFGTGVIILAIINFRKIRAIALGVALMMISFVAALTLQGSVAVLNPNFHEKFFTTIAKSINQLSMGLVDFRDKTISGTIPPTIAEPQFDGYVAESTDVRLGLTKLAFETWAQDPARIIFGVGLGGAGVAMADFSNDNSAREIVQNEYVEILLERGLIGALIFVAVIIGFFIITQQQKWAWAIAAAFMVQWIFFSGLPNALHIYLVLIILFANSISPRAQSKPAKRS